MGIGKEGLRDDGGMVRESVEMREISLRDVYNSHDGPVLFCFAVLWQFYSRLWGMEYSEQIFRHIPNNAYVKNLEARLAFNFSNFTSFLSWNIEYLLLSKG